MKYYKPKSTKSLIVHIGIAILGLLATIILFENTVGAIKIFVEDKSCNYQTEYATIVRYDINKQGNFVNYVTYYEYSNDDGEYYTGAWEAHIETEDEAKAKIGTQVTIYVDHEKRVHKTGAGTNIGAILFNGILGLIFLALMSNSLIRIILYMIYLIHKK